MSSSPAGAAAGFDFTEIHSLLSKYQQTSNSLVVPLDNSTFTRILDILTVQGIEKLADKRWNTMAEKMRMSEGDEESKQWMQLQRAPYMNYEEGQNTAQNEEEDTGGKLPNHLTQKRFDRLKNMGVAMNKWEQRLLELREYYGTHGNCDVPVNHHGGLGLWVASQRVAWRFEKATMPQGRIDALDAMGFIWQSQKRKDSWSNYFDELVEYIRQHGSSHVSAYDEKYTKLGSWVKRQRAEYKKYQEKGRAESQMTKERIDKLESIGFQWRLKPDKITWESRFEDLKQYKEIHGHCRPTQSENNELNTWSRYQRLNYRYFIEGKPSRLNQEKVDKLLSIGINDPGPNGSYQEETDDGAQEAVPTIQPQMSFHT